MCGIIGYVGQKPAQNILVDGLRRLEYRGYDSAGVCIVDDGRRFQVRKKMGRMQELLSGRGAAAPCWSVSAAARISLPAMQARSSFTRGGSCTSTISKS